MKTKLIEKESSFFEDIARKHAVSLDPGTLSFYSSFLTAADDAMVLDVGAGSGSMSAGLAMLPQVSKVIAYDVSLDAMRELNLQKEAYDVNLKKSRQIEQKELAKITKICRGSYIKLPFKNGTFGIVVCRYALHHFQHKANALEEVRRVLRKDGILLLSDAVLAEHSRDVLSPLYQIREDHYHGYLTYYELIQLLEDLSFCPNLIRPYRYRHANLSDYLHAIKDGLTDSFAEQSARASSDSQKTLLVTGVTDVLDRKLRRALLSVDSRVQREMGVVFNKENSDLSFQYFMVDVAASVISTV